LQGKLSQAGKSPEYCKINHKVSGAKGKNVPVFSVVQYLFHETIYSRQRWGGHVQFFFESEIAILQLEGRTSAIAIPQLFKEMFLHNRNSAITIFV
jgi:hypothetical protein